MDKKEKKSLPEPRTYTVEQIAAILNIGRTTAYQLVKQRGISSRTMRTAKSRIGDRLVTEKDGTAWVCYLRD